MVNINRHSLFKQNLEVLSNFWVCKCSETKKLQSWYSIPTTLNQRTFGGRELQLMNTTKTLKGIQILKEKWETIWNFFCETYRTNRKTILFLDRNTKYYKSTTISLCFMSISVANVIIIRMSNRHSFEDDIILKFICKATQRILKENG